MAGGIGSGLLIKPKGRCQFTDIKSIYIVIIKHSTIFIGSLMFVIGGKSN